MSFKSVSSLIGDGSFDNVKDNSRRFNCLMVGSRCVLASAVNTVISDVANSGDMLRFSLLRVFMSRNNASSTTMFICKALRRRRTRSGSEEGSRGSGVAECARYTKSLNELGFQGVVSGVSPRLSSAS